MQNSQENTCTGVFFLINCRLNACNFIKKRILYRKNISGRMLPMYEFSMWDSAKWERRDHFICKKPYMISIWYLFLFSSLSFTLDFFKTFPGVRRSHLQMFFEIDVLKNFAIFTGKQLCWNLFLINKVPGLKRDSNTGIFLWILRNF